MGSATPAGGAMAVRLRFFGTRVLQRRLHGVSACVDAYLVDAGLEARATAVPGGSVV